MSFMIMLCCLGRDEMNKTWMALELGGLMLVWFLGLVKLGYEILGFLPWA